MQDLHEDLLAFGLQLIEPHAHARRHALALGIVLPNPDHGPFTHDQGRAVLELELETELGADFQGVLRPDEDAALGDVHRVAFDELVQRRAAKLDLQLDWCAHRFPIVSRTVRHGTTPGSHFPTPHRAGRDAATKPPPSEPHRPNPGARHLRDPEPPLGSMRLLRLRLRLRLQLRLRGGQGQWLADNGLRDSSTDPFRSAVSLVG